MLQLVDPMIQNTVEAKLSESLLSEPSVIKMPFLIVKSKKRLDFLQNQVINEIPM